MLYTLQETTRWVLVEVLRPELYFWAGDWPLSFKSLMNID